MKPISQLVPYHLTQIIAANAKIIKDRKWVFPAPGASKDHIVFVSTRVSNLSYPKRKEISVVPDPVQRTKGFRWCSI